MIVFVAGVLVGIQLPGFVDQYGKALQAHYLESRQSLKEFQDDADKFFDGDMDRLIEHYRVNPDPVFNAGGVSIDAILERNRLLDRAYGKFHEHVYSPYLQTLLYPLADIRQEVLDSYTYVVVLNRMAISVGLLIGVLLALSVDIVLGTIGLFARWVAGALWPTPGQA